jgi:hypothetical protein
MGKMNPYINFWGMLAAVWFTDVSPRLLTENVKGVSDWSDVAQDRDKCRAVVSTVMILRAP